MTEADIDGAIDTIQQAFAGDPYNNWVYPDRSKVHVHQTSFAVVKPDADTQFHSFPGGM